MYLGRKSPSQKSLDSGRGSSPVGGKRGASPLGTHRLDLAHAQILHSDSMDSLRSTSPSPSLDSLPGSIGKKKKSGIGGIFKKLKALDSSDGDSKRSRDSQQLSRKVSNEGSEGGDEMSNPPSPSHFETAPSNSRITKQVMAERRKSGSPVHLEAVPEVPQSYAGSMPGVAGSESEDNADSMEYMPGHSEVKLSPGSSGREADPEASKASHTPSKHSIPRDRMVASPSPMQSVPEEGTSMESPTKPALVTRIQVNSGLSSAPPPKEHSSQIGKPAMHTTAAGSRPTSAERMSEGRQSASPTPTQNISGVPPGSVPDTKRTASPMYSWTHPGSISQSQKSPPPNSMQSMSGTPPYSRGASPDMAKPASPTSMQNTSAAYGKENSNPPSQQSLEGLSRTSPYSNDNKSEARSRESPVTGYSSTSKDNMADHRHSSSPVPRDAMSKTSPYSTDYKSEARKPESPISGSSSTSKDNMADHRHSSSPVPRDAMSKTSPYSSDHKSEAMKPESSISGSSSIPKGSMAERMHSSSPTPRDVMSRTSPYSNDHKSEAMESESPISGSSSASKGNMADHRHSSSPTPRDAMSRLQPSTGENMEVLKSASPTSMESTSGSPSKESISGVSAVKPASNRPAQMISRGSPSPAKGDTSRDTEHLTSQGGARSPSMSEAMRPMSVSPTGNMSAAKSSSPIPAQSTPGGEIPFDERNPEGMRSMSASPTQNTSEASPSNKNISTGKPSSPTAGQISSSSRSAMPVALKPGPDSASRMESPTLVQAASRQSVPDIKKKKKSSLIRSIKDKLGIKGEDNFLEALSKVQEAQVQKSTPDHNGNQKTGPSASGQLTDAASRQPVLNQSSSSVDPVDLEAQIQPSTSAPLHGTPSADRKGIGKVDSNPILKAQTILQVLSPQEPSTRAAEEGKRERLYKVLVVGELGTGKTSIIKRYVHQFFSQHYRATIGVDFALKVLRWDPETVVRLQLWDIAGQERFGSMTRVYYKEAVGAFVVFDVARAATLEAVPKWKQDLDSKVVLPDGRSIPAVLLANKCDQPKEGLAANREKMNEFCQQQGFSAWFETSAKENINIDEAANFLVSKILEMDKWSQEPIATDPDKVGMRLGNGPKSSSNGGCSC